MNPTSRKKKIWTVVRTAFFVLILWTIWGNVTVKTTVWDIKDNSIPEGFDGYRIAQISDLHNAEFGENHAKLLSILEKEQPNIIVITGDLVDANHTDMDIAVSFAEQATQIAPCYYVTGNHEAWLGERYDDLEKRLKDCGVNVLRNQAERITANGDSVWLMGVDDPDFAESGIFDLSSCIIAAKAEHTGNEAEYKILLSHRPELFHTYVKEGIHLVFCGHAHGGQFRLPFIGGLVAPNQGIFPQYDSGIYQEKDTTMVVSRGIGNSIIPVRLNNRPEVVIAVMHT